LSYSDGKNIFLHHPNPERQIQHFEPRKVLKATFLQQQWASNDKSTINQTQYNTVAMLPGSIATALLM